MNADRVSPFTARLSQLFVAGGVMVCAVWFFAARGWLLYFGDAEAHLNIARRLTDTKTPGWEQLGSPWLPLPHLLMAPFAAVDAWWFSGIAGSIAPAVCMVLAAWWLAASAREVFGNEGSSWAAMLVFLLNPNALYLGSTAMTEGVFAAALCGLLYVTIRFHKTRSLWWAAAAGLLALAGTWTRYEGWFLLPFCAVYILTRGWVAALLFSGIAAMGPLVWLFYNWWLSGNALDFFNGPSSAIAIQGSAVYPGLHNWGMAWFYYRTCMRLVLGETWAVALVIGGLVAVVRGKWWPVLLLALPPAFYVWSMHGSGTPIHVPELWPHSWYNTRYGLAALPLLSFCAAALSKGRWAVIVVAVVVLPWMWHPTAERWITWKESQQNSISRRAWTQETADYLKAHRRPGEEVFTEFGDLTGAFRFAGIPLRETFHAGNGLAWQAAVQRPDLLMHSTWVVCQRRDSELSRAMRGAVHYRLAKSIVTPYADPVDIYRYANSIH